MTEQERIALTDATIHLLLLKDGDRDHMNHSDITCEQSMAIVELLRLWKSSVPANLSEILKRATTLEPELPAARPMGQS